MKNKKEVRKVVRVASVFVSLLVLALMAYGIFNIEYINQGSSTLIYNYNILGLFFVSFLLDLIPQFVSPMVTLGVGIVAGVNIYYAILATVVGSLIGSVVGFALGKKYMFEAVDVLTTEKSSARLTHLVNKYGKIIVPLTAISPLPYLPVLFGAMNLSKKNFLIYGILPRIVGIVGVGILVYLI